MEPEQSEETLSALRANIKAKGSNAYYYAHGMKVDGPQWDGKEEPRLLEVSTVASAGATQRKIESLSEYAWMDADAHVKIHLDFENADSIDDSNISLETMANSIKFTIAVGDKDRVLYIDSLQDAIESASYRKKSSKFIISLKKSVPSAWYQLKKDKK